MALATGTTNHVWAVSVFLHYRVPLLQGSYPAAEVMSPRTSRLSSISGILAVDHGGQLNARPPHWCTHGKCSTGIVQSIITTLPRHNIHAHKHAECVKGGQQDLNLGQVRAILLIVGDPKQCRWVSSSGTSSACSVYQISCLLILRVHQILRIMSKFKRMVSIQHKLLITVALDGHMK